MTQQVGYGLIPKVNNEISKGGIKGLLDQIRPVWKGRNLIHRVELLLPVDASSACQRLFNAAIHDLKEKIIVIGVGLAKEVAVNNKLPQVNSEDDILNYNVSKSIDLAYRIGLLTRAEWSRMHRCYEIRRDLEHEDNEYEAVLEDVFYIFKSVIEIVLANDPIELLQVIDAKEIVEASTNLMVSQEFLHNFKNAPNLRQKEITELLVSYAFDESKPDIVRQNSVELMRNIQPLTPNTVTIEIASIIEKRLNGKIIDLKTAKISNACGAIAYFKKIRLKEFYEKLLEELKDSVNDWSDQALAIAKLEDVGGLSSCPPEVYARILKYLVQAYIGEPSYGPNSGYRPVFYSNKAVPIIARLIQSDSARIGEHLEALKGDKTIKSSISNNHVRYRFEALIEMAD